MLSVITLLGSAYGPCFPKHLSAFVPCYAAQELLIIKPWFKERRGWKTMAFITQRWTVLSMELLHAGNQFKVCGFEGCGERRDWESGEQGNQHSLRSGGMSNPFHCDLCWHLSGISQCTVVGRFLQSGLSGFLLACWLAPTLCPLLLNHMLSDTNGDANVLIIIYW